MTTATATAHPAAAPLLFKHGTPPKLRKPGLHSIIDTGATFGYTKRADTSVAMPAPKPAPPTSWPASTRTLITNATMTETYNGHELGLTVNRPGAADAMALPSRVGRHLHYRDGRTALAT